MGRSSGQSFPDLSDGEAAAQEAPLIANIAVFMLVVSAKK
jgi:hypothetical protein